MNLAVCWMTNVTTVSKLVIMAIICYTKSRDDFSVSDWKMHMALLIGDTNEHTRRNS